MPYVPDSAGSSDADRLRLALALAGSLLFHGLLLGADRLIDLRPRRAAAPPPLQATLLAAPLPAPVLIAPETPQPAPPAAAPKPKSLPPPTSRPPERFRAAVGAAATAALRQIAQNLFYPPEAVAQGLEGEAQVMLFIDEAGNAVAVRLENSSGHALLDEAAVRAARAVRALPEGAPREVLLPVRFRLR